jgi:pilus assembly protein CpaB
MRGRTLILFILALALAGGTAMMMRSWLAQRETAIAAAPAPTTPPAPQQSVMVARTPIVRGQILKPSDLGWQIWPAAEINKAYILSGSKTVEDFAGWVAREPFVAGEPIIEPKIVSPGDRGFLAAVLRPGMRAVSVPVTATSGISGFVFPGDQVDILITHPLPASGNGGGLQHKAAETVLRDVRVIAIDQSLSGKGGEPVLAKTATLEVTPKQSEIIAVATEMGKLSLSLRPLAAPPVADVEGETAEDGDAGTFTIDSEVSRLLPKPFTKKPNLSEEKVTVLRGNGNSGNANGTQTASGGP